MTDEIKESKYTNLDSENYPNENINVLLEKCEEFSKNVDTLSANLNEKNINGLNINSNINELIEKLKQIKKYKDSLSLSDEDRKKINKIFDKLRKDFVNLKNKHVHTYNEKVDYINERINSIIKGIDINTLFEEEKEAFNKLSTISRCDVDIVRNWNQNRYLKTLDYSKLLEMYRSVEILEVKLNIRIEEPLGLFTSANYIENLIRKIRRNLNNDLSITDINSSLDTCITLFERIENLNISYNNVLDKLSEQMITKYGNKIETFKKEIKEIETKLLEKKNNLIKKNNCYTIISNKLEQVNNKYEILLKKILEYLGKCSEETIKAFNFNLDELSKEMFNIKDDIIKSFNDKELNQEQLNNIYMKIHEIAEKHKNIDTKLNDELVILREIDKELHITKNISKLDNELNELNNKLNYLEGIIKDKNIRKEIDNIIKNREKDLKRFEHLLLYMKDNEPDKYENLNNRITTLKNRFDEICKNYRSKCPLRVKTTKEIKHLYKKYKKMGLISAGLSSLALLSSAFSLIPAIMHGNTVAGEKIPPLKSLLNFFNKILSGCIGVKINKQGIYQLANGALLNAKTATTSLLKSLASFTGGIAAAMMPAFVPQIITKIKQLIEKIKNYELKEKLVKTYEKSRKKVKDSSEQIQEKIHTAKIKKDIKIAEKNYEELFQEYLKSNMSIEEFCKNKNLTDKVKEYLELKERRKQILEETKKQEEEKIKELINDFRRKKNG